MSQRELPGGGTGASCCQQAFEWATKFMLFSGFESFIQQEGENLEAGRRKVLNFEDIAEAKRSACAKIEGFKNKNLLSEVVKILAENPSLSQSSARIIAWDQFYQDAVRCTRRAIHPCLPIFEIKAGKELTYADYESRKAGDTTQSNFKLMTRGAVSQYMVVCYALEQMQRLAPVKFEPGGKYHHLLAECEEEGVWIMRGLEILNNDKTTMGCPIRMDETRHSIREQCGASASQCKPVAA